VDDQGVPERLARLVAMSSGDGRRDTVIRLTCGRVLSLPPLPTEVDLTDGDSDGVLVVAAFAEQFAVDVTGIEAHQRKQLLSVLGDKAFRTVTAIFIADFVPRVWAGFDALGLGKPGNGRVVEWDVTRNACNKIAVSLGAGAARVGEGTEEYSIDAEGQTVCAS
jgi:hypothetical protein